MSAVKECDSVNGSQLHNSNRFILVWHDMAWYGISVHFLHFIYKITQDAEREMHEVQYLYVAFP